jgi:hypothetical protein
MYHRDGNKNKTRWNKMRKRTIISALALTMAIGAGATAYAASADSAAPGTPGQRLGLGKITSMKGYEYITSILKDKLGLSDEDITNALNSGKTPYNLAAEKGMTQYELRKSLLEERTKAIDAAVTDGTITKEAGEDLKAKLNTNMENCTGNFGQGRGQGRGQGPGIMGNGQGRGCFINTK